MFIDLRQLSAPKISAVILRWIFYYSKLFGVSNFRLKTTTEGEVQVKDSTSKWKWLGAIYSLGHLQLFIYIYVYWLKSSNDGTAIALHSCRLMMNVICCLCILRLQLFQSHECIQLINRFLKLFQRVRDICHQQDPKRTGFGGKQELILLILLVVGIVHDKLFLIGVFQMESNIFYIICWFSDTYISIGSQLLMHFAFVWYLALGFTLSELNEYIRTQLRSQLEALEAQPSRRKLCEARKALDKCLNLHQDLLSLTSRFQKIYDLILFLSLIQNCASIASFSYTIVIKLQLNWIWLWSKTFMKILNMLLLCLSVQRAVLQFGMVRRLVLENCYLSDIKDWHRTLDMFFTYLSLYELRVCPMGLFNISNELLVVFLSALVNYFTVVIQYGMQQSVVLRALEQLNFLKLNS